MTGDDEILLVCGAIVGVALILILAAFLGI